MKTVNVFLLIILYSVRVHVSVYVCASVCFTVSHNIVQVCVCRVVSSMFVFVRLMWIEWWWWWCDDDNWWRRGAFLSSHPYQLYNKQTAVFFFFLLNFLFYFVFYCRRWLAFCLKGAAVCGAKRRRHYNAWVYRWIDGRMNVSVVVVVVVCV